MGRRDEGRTARRLALLVCGLGALAVGGTALAAPTALGAGPQAHPAPVAAAPTAHMSAAGALVHGQREGAARVSQTIALVLPLKADEAGLQRHALAVTTIGSPQYGQYESIAVLARQYGAPPSARRQVTAYLRSQGPPM